MLKTLTVNNFALVDYLEIQFDEGLTVITGESGAGKSILLGALGLVLGERAVTDAIRPGTRRADVSAEFDVSGIPEAAGRLSALDLDDPDQPGRALVRRVVNADGRSRAFLNGTPVTLEILRSITAGLIDIHGQDDNHRLADPAVQRTLLDAYGVDPELLVACRDAFRAWKHSADQLAKRQASLKNQEDRVSLLTYQLEELDEAAPQAAEFEEVEQSHKRLSQAQTLKDAVHDALESLASSDNFGQARTALSRLDDAHPDLLAARETLVTIADLADDAIRDLRSYEASLSFDADTLSTIEKRLSELHELARKHRVNPESLPELIEDLRSQLDAISTDRSSLAELALEAERFEADFRRLAENITRQRLEAAEAFCQAVSGHMRTLGIDGGALAVEFHPRETEHGFESVEYLCVTNPKYPAAALSKIASGGERARISLSIQIVAAQRCQLPSLVLDEADVGVGGTTADVVGRLLRGLAAHTQVICVTHAPQITALGNAHLRVRKDSAQDTRIEVLSEPERVDELARMLAGAEITEESKEYARTLLKDAAEVG
jgi:DNA repair protein RecN (Recombination protein N)